ncbi:hypothetical protein [Micromonospora sp. NPDC003776]
MSKNLYIGAPIVVTGPAGPLHAALTRPNRDLAVVRTKPLPERYGRGSDFRAAASPSGRFHVALGLVRELAPSFGPALDLRRCRPKARLIAVDTDHHDPDNTEPTPIAA